MFRGQPADINQCRQLSFSLICTSSYHRSDWKTGTILSGPIALIVCVWRMRWAFALLCPSCSPHHHHHHPPPPCNFVSALQVQSKLSLLGRGLDGERRRLLRPDAGAAAQPRQLLQGHPQLCHADGLLRRQRLRPGTGGGGVGAGLCAFCDVTTSWQSLTSAASVRYQQVLTNDSCTKCRPGSRWQSRPTSTGSPGPPGRGAGYCRGCLWAF